jgi:hypothetical protein
MMQWFGDSVKVSRLRIGKAAAGYTVLLKNCIGLSYSMKQVGRTYAAQLKNIAIHSPSFSSENSLTKKEGEISK